MIGKEMTAWLEAEGLLPKDPAPTDLVRCPECKGDAEYAPCATCGCRRWVPYATAEQYRRDHAQPYVPRRSGNPLYR